MTQVFRKKMFPDASTECVMCMGGEGDSAHLFFWCSFAQIISGVDVTSYRDFWGSPRVRVLRREAEWGRILAVLWAIWLHHDKVIFDGIGRQ